MLSKTLGGQHLFVFVNFFVIFCNSGILNEMVSLRVSYIYPGMMELVLREGLQASCSSFSSFAREEV